MVFTGTVQNSEPPGRFPATERLVSGEAVELDVRVARLGSRVLALLLDILVELFLFGILLYVSETLVVTVARSFADEALSRAVAIVVIVATLVGYPAAMETLLGGRTLGKLALGLRVVRDDGGPIGFRQALIRALTGVALEWPGVLLPLLTWLVALTTMLVNPQSKRIGDLMAGTIVIHERAPASWGWVPAMPPQLAGWATLLDLTGLDDDLALAVRHFLARNRQIGEPARSRLGYALAAEVAACTTPPPPHGVPGWAYLAAVLAERHRRAALRLAAARGASGAVWRDIGPPIPLTAPPVPPVGPAFGAPATTVQTSRIASA
jgi:uncharacterized RDD family membrane protein YckC